MKTHRRNFLAGSLSASLLTSAGTPPDTLQRETLSSDVIVVGAGLAGLRAALLLEDEGFNVTVLEAQERVGGRVLSFTDLPGNPEAGANSFFSGYGRTLSLCNELGVGYYDFRKYQRPASTVLNIKGEFIQMGAWATSEHNPLPAPLKAMPPGFAVNKVISDTNPLQAPEDWLNPSSASMDISLHRLLTENGWSDNAIALCYDHSPRHGRSSFEASSLLWFFIDAWIKQLAASAGTEWVAQKGNQELPKAMARALKSEVRLKKDVVSIHETKSAVEIKTRDGSRYTAKSIILALPISPLRSIRFEHGLPPLLRAAFFNVPQMPISQVHLIPTAPFWEEDGLPPGMWTDRQIGQVIPICGEQVEQKISYITAWARGFGATYFDSLGADGAAQFVLDELYRLRPAARGNVRVGAFKSWQLDPYSGGDWVVWKPGQIHQFHKALRQPFGRIYFAGEHTSTHQRGMEAALESGERAAIEVLTR